MMLLTGESALHIAIVCGEFQMGEFDCHGEMMLLTGESALHIAIVCGEFEMVK